MTNEEALNHFKNHEYMTDYSWQDEMSEIAIKAIEKQIPKKAMGYICPTCGEEFCTEMWEVDYCCGCGQRLKWRESE